MTIQIWRCPHLRTDIIDVLNWAGGTFSNQVGTTPYLDFHLLPHYSVIVVQVHTV